MKPRPPKILFFVTEDWFFCSHFLDRAVAARREGYNVAVVTRVQKHGEKIASQGLKVIPVDLARRRINPWREWQVIRNLTRIYKLEHADIVHHVALKPVLYGTIAAWIAGVSAIVNAPVGMGYIFSSNQRKAVLLRPLVMLGYRLLLNPRNSCVVLENRDDQQMLTNMGVVDPERIRLIRGAGVDLNLFLPAPESVGLPVVVLAARMLWDKGVKEFVEAAQRLRADGVQARFVLVGDHDPGNPAAIPVDQLHTWKRSGVVEWWGWRDDMPKIFAQSHVVCLPSYREGLPKALIEAAACGKAIVATDVPGCREVVQDGYNGFLVPARDPSALAAALKRLVRDAALRRRMGANGRRVAELEFALQHVVTGTLSLYKELLNAPSGKTADGLRF